MSFDLLSQNGDLVITNGDFATVSNEDKLIQDILKIVLTEVGGNPLNQWYGSLIGKTLIGSILPQGILISTAKQQLTTALQNLQNLQNLQVASSQPVTPGEQLAFVSGISIAQGTADPRAYQIVIQVLNRAFGQVSAEFVASNF
jgi:hypothetical protein